MLVSKIYKNISGWGNFPKMTCPVYVPQSADELSQILKDTSLSNFISRGCGRSYGDASLQANGVISTSMLNKILSFDANTGILSAQAGATLDTIMQLIIPHLYILPVIPGTKNVSLGGAIASNIHGKNQYKFGNFIEHVINIKLRLPNNEVVTCDRSHHRDLFFATAGGMGMTGHIEEVTLKLHKIPSHAFDTYAKKTQNIQELINLFLEYKDQADYMVGWIDHFSHGKNIGKGIFEYANHHKLSPEEMLTHSESQTPLKSKKLKLNVPFYFPSFVLNKYSMAIYNQLRFIKCKDEFTHRLSSFDDFFHPLDNINNWNRLYGTRGFLQYQFLCPNHPQVADQIEDIIRFIQDKDLFSFLAVIKYHRASEGMLCFAGDGFTVAMDFPNNPKIIDLIKELDQKNLSLGGRIFLAKDALLEEATFEKMYAQNLPQWRQVLKNVNPNQKFSSAMAQRLNFFGN